MKKRKTLFYLSNIAALILMWLSLYLQRTVGRPWSTISFFLGFGIFLLASLVIRLRKEKEQVEAFDREQEASAGISADPFSAAEEEDAPPSLLLFHNPSGRIYQVFCDERAFLFYQVGGELLGITAEKLLDHCPSPGEFDALPGKNFRVEKGSVDQAVFSPKTVTTTPIPSFGLISLYSPKRRNYILLDQLSTQQVLRFFRDLGPRIKLDQKALDKHEEDLSIGRQKKAQQDPACYRRLYIASIVLLVLGAVSSLGFLFISRPYELWAGLCLLCYTAVVTLALVFPDYFSLIRSNSESMRETGAKSIGMIGPMVASGIGLVLRSLLDFNFIPFWSIYLAGLIFSVLLTVLFFWRFQEIRRRFVTLLSAWFLLLVFSLGVPAQLNALLDFQDPRIVPVEVVDKHISHSSRGPDLYVLTVRLSDGPDQDLNTRRGIYNDTEIGDEGSMAVFSGAIHMPYVEFIPNSEKGDAASAAYSIAAAEQAGR